jgi:hypothetical protein
VPTAIIASAGADQRGTVGQPLDTALTVFVTDKFGDPVPGVLVRFSVPEGHGGLSPVAQTTGPGGHASTSWSLPTASGTYHAFAKASGLDSLAFQATALAAPPALLTLVRGDSQVALPQAEVDSAVVVLVRDGYGNPVSGVPVSFVPAPGAGSADPPIARTDSTGRARTVWTLGEASGLHALTVKLDSLHQIRVRARALHQPGLVLLTPGTPGGGPLWGGVAAGTDQSILSAGQFLPRLPTPDLRCWHNALGDVPLDPATDRCESVTGAP